MTGWSCDIWRKRCSGEHVALHAIDAEQESSWLLKSELLFFSRTDNVFEWHKMVFVRPETMFHLLRAFGLAGLWS